MENPCNAFYWTLVHSLWIGLAAALLTGMVLLSVPARAAAKRYRLLCGLLVLFVLAVVAIFIAEWQSTTHVTDVYSLSRKLTSPVHPGEPVTGDLTLGYWAFLPSWLNAKRDLFLLIWAICFGLKSLRLAGSLVYIGRIRNSGVSPVSAVLQEKLQAFSRQLRFSHAIQLLQSDRVNLPVTFGWLKPVILIPAGLLLQATPEQLDSILWHELAHICRRDYLVNLLQELVETLFFFNPALLWLCACIRIEREACCDDLAMAREVHQKDYVHTLLSLYNRPGQPAGLALGTGSGRQLRRRLKRLATSQTAKSNATGKVLAVAGLLLLSAFTLLSGNIVSSFKPAPRDTVISFSHLRFDGSDADPDNCSLLAEDTRGNNYRMTITGGMLSSLKFNQAQVSAAELSRYGYLVTSLKLALGRKRHKLATNSPRGQTPPLRQRLKLAASLVDNKAIDRVKQVIAALVSEKVVATADQVKWFGLTDTQLIVNGQAQPQALQGRLQSLAAVRKYYGLFYGPVRMSGKGVFVDETDLR